jgi:type II secretory pathway pseudopilin PulG
MATTLTLITVVAVPIFIALLTLFIAPSIARRQTDRRVKEAEEKQATKDREVEAKQARKEQEAAERQAIKEKAQQEAALQYLEKIVALREFFAVETARQKQVTDGEMDRANAEIGRAKEKIDRLSDSLEEVKATLAKVLASRQ